MTEDVAASKMSLVTSAGPTGLVRRGLHEMLEMMTWRVSTLAGSGEEGFADGPGASAQFYYPDGIAVDGAGNLYVADMGNDRIRKITPQGMVSTLAGSGEEGFADGPGVSAQFYLPTGMAVDGAGNLYVGDSHNDRIRKIAPQGLVSTLAGSGEQGLADGPDVSAQFYFPTDIAVDGAGNLCVSDSGNHRIRKITPQGLISTLAGSGEEGFADGPGASAQFDNPTGIAVDGAGNLYVADMRNHRIRKITPQGMVSTLAGSGEEGFADGPGVSAQFNNPDGIAVDGAGNLYVADSHNDRIRKITPQGMVSTLAGSGEEGFADGPGASAQFDNPTGIAMNGAGNLYVTDYLNHRIRKIMYFH